MEDMVEDTMGMWWVEDVVEDEVEDTTGTWRRTWWRTPRGLLGLRRGHAGDVMEAVEDAAVEDAAEDASASHLPSVRLTRTAAWPHAALSASSTSSTCRGSGPTLTGALMGPGEGI